MIPRLIISSIAGASIALANATSTSAQEFSGKVEITTHTLGMQELLNVVGENVASIMDLPIAAIAAAAGVETETYSAKIRGPVVYAAMDEGDMIVNYETGRFTMYDPANDVHATWTGDELRETMAAMMGGGPQGRPDMAAALAQMRSAMGVTEEEPEGPYSLNTEDDCGEWWGGRMGTVSLEGNPMQPAWVFHACVTQDFPDAWRSFKAMTDASNQFDPMDTEDAQDKMENAILERGLPTVTKRLEKGGGMTPSIEFEVTVFRVTPGPVAADEVTPKGREVTLEEFLRLRMRGMR